ncbi:hypothetical protein T440DRAFT_473162 [Plenodomus tracheiphilus IPT5]|uniref:Uncharacterized protein n=1 Tax=Plenodomus tracheiphilus IPT5 TaxID=1408161 RepID=A0A6A7ANE3_9PLEO|nr:hypothetical protein T440DRAFT_473162 [Plenodomus tracheiphilus IPT5]
MSGAVTFVYSTAYQLDPSRIHYPNYIFPASRCLNVLGYHASNTKHVKHFVPDLP